ncbi:hypothetical protein P9112_004829 [Eukaryota sp. TZLM1-RC]
MAEVTVSKRLHSEADLPVEPSKRPSPEKTPAKVYPFELDSFQREAVTCIENQQSVLVSAHTSAGKTVVAEYAIAQSIRNSQRVVYTSPIKALSNQKYRDFQSEFKDVGLMTGDVTISPNAQCLVMTTEILRSMLYRGSEVVKEVAWVVFDEVHYLMDPERGVVWEETLILLPSTVRFVFLSATVPNAKEFAGWVESVHKQPVTVVHTDFRPTPLLHYVFPQGSSKFVNVIDKSGKFNDDKFAQAIGLISEKASNTSQMELRRGGRKKKGRLDLELNTLIKHLKEFNYFPVIIFSFARKECETNALSIQKFDLTTSDEKFQVDFIFNAAIEGLSEDDKQIPAIKSSLPLLKQGIGIHHSGLFPILKEVTEILFQEGLVKVLFATETFSMGLNMPAKTVVFTDITKFDGVSERKLNSGEYIQMSGRAGRRGKDTEGLVIVMLNDRVEPPEMKEMMMGRSNTLDSKFHLSYNMILNTMRVEEITAEDLIDKSYLSFQKSRQIPELEAKVEELEQEIKDIYQDLERYDVDLEEFESLYTLNSVKEELEAKILSIIVEPTNIIPFLNPLRPVKLKRPHNVSWSNSEQDDSTLEYGWGVVIETTRSQIGETVIHQVRCLVNTDATDNYNQLPCKSNAKPLEKKPEVVTFDLDCISAISRLRLQVSATKLDSLEGKKQLMGNLEHIVSHFRGDLPLLDPLKDMKIKSDELDDAYLQLVDVDEMLRDHVYYKQDNILPSFEKYVKSQKLKENKEKIQNEIRTSQKVLLQSELTGMKRVLRTLGFVDDNGVTTKGRVAAEISTGDELMLAELILDGTFLPLTPTQINGLLSCFAIDERKEKKNKEYAIPASIKSVYEDLLSRAKTVGEAAQQARLDISVDDYVAKFKPSMMKIVMDWSEGASFKDIMDQTEEFEGQIIKVIKRLDELLRQLSVVAKNICNDELELKFVAAIKSIKRDIAFSASLYI